MLLADRRSVHGVDYNMRFPIRFTFIILLSLSYPIVYSLATAGSGKPNLLTNSTSGMAGDPDPIAMTYDEANHAVYVADPLLDTVSVINSTTESIIARLPVGIEPVALLYDPANTFVYVANNGSGTISVLSSLPNPDNVATVVDGPHPHFEAFDPANNFVYVTNLGPNGMVSVISSTSSPTLVTQINVGIGSASIAFDPANQMMYVDNPASSSVSAINSTNAVVATLGVGAGPTALAFDSANNRMYVTEVGPNNVTGISASNTIASVTHVGTTPVAMAFDPINSCMYVGNAGSGTESIVDCPGTPGLAATVVDGPHPHKDLFVGANNDVYVGNDNSTIVSVLNSATPPSLVTSIMVGQSPTSLVFDPANGFVYAGNSGSRTISVISSSTNIVVATIALPTAAPCPTRSVIGVCSEAWYPAGPAVDHLNIPVFANRASEYTGLTSNQIDLMDSPLTAAQTLLPPSFYVTTPVDQHGYAEIEFNLDNNFWGCQMLFGNSTCGINIRQGIAHLVDRTKFTPSTGGFATDVPQSRDNGGLPAPNHCTWDTLYPQTGCLVGDPGGTAYRLAPATGLPAYVQTLTSPDACAAAGHFIAAGLATGTVGYGSGVPSLTTCQTAGSSARLSGITAVGNVTFFIRLDDPDLQALGTAYARGICALFTGSFTNGCPGFLITVTGPKTAFSGFQTSTTSINRSWWMYTSEFQNQYPFDASLYYTYNSAFVSGIPSDKPPCSSSAVPSSNAENYIYNCEILFDQLTTSMEYASCISGGSDPTSGMLIPTYSNCQGTQIGAGTGSTICTNGTLGCTAVSAGYQAEDLFGAHEKTIPAFTRAMEFAYPSTWQRVINSQGAGVPNFFTWLNAYNVTNSTLPRTLRSGFDGSTVSLNPYVASSSHELTILGNIMDTLAVENPLNKGQVMCWMCNSYRQISNNMLGYTPPNGTVTSYRFFLRSDIFAQDGRTITAFDVAFSYLTLKATGAFQASGLFPILAITILAPTQFDINLKAVGPFTLQFLTASIPSVEDPGPTIFPGRYWSTAGATNWDTAVQSCRANRASCFPSTYFSSAVCTGVCGFPGSYISVSAAMSAPTFDPLSSGILIGSGPWECQSSMGVVGTGCSSSGSQSPPIGGSFSLTRFAVLSGSTPGNPSQTFYRSSGTYAQYLWTGMTGDATHDFILFTAVSACYANVTGSPQPWPGSGTISAPFYRCGHFRWGIGSAGQPSSIGIVQISEENRFVQLDWTFPFAYPGTTLTGMYWSTPGALAPPLLGSPPILYEGSFVIDPAWTAGCSVTTHPSWQGYDC